MAYRWWQAADPTYDPADLATAIKGAAYAVDANGHLWLFGGEAPGSTYLTAVRSFDPVTNTWTSHPSLPSAFYPYCSAAIAGGKAYLMDDGLFWAYDLATGVTTVLTATGSTTWGYDLVALGGKIYWRMDHHLPLVYDIATDAWSQPVTPWAFLGTGAYRGWGSVVTDGTHIYVGVYEYLGRYDPATDAWTRMTDADSRHALDWTGLTLDGTTIYLTGGDSGGTPSAAFSTYDITTDAWTIQTDLPTARLDFQHGATDSRLYLAGGDDGTTILTSNVMWAETAPNATPADPASLTVTHTVTLPSEMLLPVSWRTDRAAGDAGATLRTTWATGTTLEAALPILWSEVEPDGLVVPDAPGATGGVPAPGGGPIVTGTLQHSFGAGPTGTLDRLDGTFPTAGATTFTQHLATPAGWRQRTVGMRTAAAPYGRSWSTQGFVPISTLQTGSHGAPLGTILPELVRVPTVQAGGMVWTVPTSGVTPGIYAFDADLGDTIRATEDDCAARTQVDATGRQTRLDLAREVVAEVGMTLVTLGTIPNASRFVEWGYRTEGATASDVLSDMLLGSDPRTWYLDGVVVIDARSMTIQATTDPVAFLDADLLADDGASWTDQPARTEPEPVLADYTDRCERLNPDATDADATDAEVPGTFETFDDGTYEWTERIGSGDDYRETRHALRKSRGQVVQEVAETRGRFRLNYDSQLQQWGIVHRVDTRNYFHPICDDALTSRTERTMQRKTVEDIPNVSGTLGETTDATWSASEEKALISAAIPDWYAEREVDVDQAWHAEGWLRSKQEVTRALDGMIATPVADEAGVLTGYTVQLTYSTETRVETYLPVGNGLWHVQTTVRRVVDKPIYELVNPDAVNGDDDYGETELVDVIATPVENTYTAITDQAPPSISCGETPGDEESDPCSDDQDRYSQCIAEQTRRWEIDHADWEARQRHNAAKRIWTIQANRLIPDVRVGQLLAGGLVASVTHERSAASASTEMQVWEWLP